MTQAEHAEHCRIIDDSNSKGILMRVAGRDVRGTLRGALLDFPIASAVVFIGGENEFARYEISWDLARRAVDEGIVIK